MHEDMMHEATPEAIRKETRVYILVFAALATLTVVTVGVSYLDLSKGPAIALALTIAIVKGSLVACYFMHLISEKRVVYYVLILTVLFFAALMLAPVYGHLGSTAVE
jgi:cytochrome c oxidase subunit 4